MNETEQAHVGADAALARGDPAGAIAALRVILLRQPDDFDGWMKLGAVQRALCQPEEALVSIDRALQLRPVFYLALLFKGALLEGMKQEAMAAELYRAALFHAPSNAELSPVICKQLIIAKQFVAQYQDDLEQRIRHDIGNLGRADAVLLDRFVDSVVRHAPIYHQEPTHYRFPHLADIEFFDHFVDDRVVRIEQSTDAILAEFNQLVNANAAAIQPYVNFAPGQPVGQWNELDKSPKWNALHLIRHGEVVNENAKLCPSTMALFSDGLSGGIAGLMPNLMFSLLAPRTRIPPHHGVANFRVVLHLPLIVPDNCGFRVGSQTRTWQKGKAWVFDDSIEHEAWNESDELRVILIADLWRPELTHTQRGMVRAMMAAVFRDKTAIDL